MGYATTIYAVDLASLRAAVGSKDADLLERVSAAAQDPAAGVDPTQGPRIKVTRDSQVSLNGRSMTPDEMRSAIRDPRWGGTNLYWYHERGQKSGIWSEAGSLMRAIQSASAGTRIAGILCCNTEDELVAGWDNDELPDEQAAAELVAGTLTRPDRSYGYGLEVLCRVLGTRLGVIEGKARLKALKLDSPLVAVRCPVPMPASAGFPSISFLTADEVQHEANRLETIAPSSPQNAAIERDRRQLLEFLRTAAADGRAVLAFYY